ncbi:MAG: type pilus modification protein PilV [Betaproteobacteria bacterium]|jgi:type IV pilus assembly protein PilV|nr:type pilus modification protein PilV [Betaproteobacteria bacterium]
MYRPNVSRIRQSGMTMLEVLITIVIVAFGLLGVAGLQARMHVAETEAYQRAQATMLLRYMTDRINANRKNGMSYVTASALGGALQDCSGLSGGALDLCEWNNLLAGASETKGGQSVGGMIAARGCVFNTVASMPRQFTVAVVWQGLSPTVASSATTCGSGTYADDKTRRAMVAPITIGCLQNDPNTGLCVTP